MEEDLQQKRPKSLEVPVKKYGPPTPNPKGKHIQNRWGDRARSVEKTPDLDQKRPQMIQVPPPDDGPGTPSLEIRATCYSSGAQKMKVMIHLGAQKAVFYPEQLFNM